MSPNYQFECESCDHKEEKVFPISTAPKIRTCPMCGQHTLYKLIGRGYMLKMDGPGFFKPGTHPGKTT